VHIAHGYYYYFGFKDYESALEQVELGLKGQSSNSEIIGLMGYIKRRQGKYEEAVAALIKAARLDPRHVDYVNNVSTTYLGIRNWAEAERYADRYITVAPDQSAGYSRKATVHLRSKGDIERAREIYQEALEKVGPDVLIDERSYIEILARDYQKALDIVEASASDWFLWKAYIYRYMGRQEQSIEYFDSARITYEERISKKPDDYRSHGNLGIAYAGLGRREEAISEGKLAIEILPLSRDAASGATMILDLAEIYAMLGDQDAAIDQLEVLLSIPSTLTVPLLKLDPQWDPLREHPRFKGLVGWHPSP
ncbi:MAG: tetratricopeptide repeat protein, partial [Candidatus Brocadiales bacterium]|nr:tetratricopeptide repeat protein [Candidatus Bathyanammoxibius sp.]